ncbi:MAG: ABC transporter permease [Candidatus Bathyarchaeota archaeon]|jgi:ABC-2 type transport system permease protein
MPRTLTVIYSAFRLAMLHWMADPQWVIPNVIAPFIFTFVALTLFKEASGPFGLYAVLGGGMMGMWGNTLYSSGFAIEFEKWQGTLEEVVATPSNLLHVIAGRSISNALFGLTNMVAILLIASLVFRIPLGIVNPTLFALSIVLTLLSVSALGLIFASAFVLSRYTQVFTNGMEFPIYVISGSMFPITLLPFWIHPASYILGPTWGIEAIRIAAGQESVSNAFWVNVGVMLLITLAYVAIAAFLFKKVETKSRRDGTLGQA